MVEQAPPATTCRSRTRLVVQGLLSLVLVVAIFYYLLTKIDPGQVWAAITAMTDLELTVLGLLAAWNLCRPSGGLEPLHLRLGVDDGDPGAGVLAGHGHEHLTWQGPFEIVALTGTLSQDGTQLHLAVADQQGRTIGGRLAEGCTVRTTVEVVLAADDRLLFAREHDPATGYDELVVHERDP